MRIERLQVDEGFLDKLDVRFMPGLNVLIGARGTGKTSIIELIRFCLGAPSFTDDAALRGQQQALSILGSGRASLTLLDGDTRLVVSRSAKDAPEIRATGVTVLAQNEMEAVGTHAAGRLHIVDRYRKLDTRDDELLLVSSRLRSATTELRGILTELAHLADQIELLSTIPDQLVDAQAEQARLLESIAATDAERNRLEGLQQIGARLGAARIVLEKGQANIAQLQSILLAAPDPEAALDDWPTDLDGDDPLQSARSALRTVALSLEAAVEAAAQSASIVADLAEQNRADRVAVDDDSRSLRGQLNALQEGAGEITRRVDSLREQAGQLQALSSLRAARQERGEELLAHRRAVYAELDELRGRRFQERQLVAERLNQELDPRIRVVVTQSAGRSDYEAGIVAALRGSGVHYNEVAPRLAGSVTPLELVELAEDGQVAELAKLAGISPARSNSVVQQLRVADTSDIVASNIEDAAEFFLLDGTSYKPTSQLSIGQRCTVILPLLLSQHGDVLVVDQPEDHIDNAFIANTLVRALRARHETDQFIFSSHNPNIPVLAEADWVVHMDSDGRRGFVRSEGDLNDQGVVDAITSVMEGGTRAFETRARFYGSGAGVSSTPNDD